MAGVEVSTDGGTTWHPATGTTSWSYSWIAHGAPSTTIRARAVDDTRQPRVVAAEPQRRRRLPVHDGRAERDADGRRPAATPSAVELGVEFKADLDGSITGVRFYKATANTGTHIGNLWTTTGTLLARGTFSERDARRAGSR